jgi:ankyrin repeat protein
VAGVDDIIGAAARGEIEHVARLLDSDPTLAIAANMFGAQAIHAAHFGGHRALVDLLLSRGVVLDAFLAAALGMLDNVRSAVTADPQLVHAFSPAGSMLLHRACYWGQAETAKYLLEQDADANVATRDSFLQIRPLGCAVATANIPNPSDDEDVVLDLVRLLIAHRVNVNGRRRDGLTALHGAAYRGHVRVIALLLENGADPSIRGHEDSEPHAGQTPADVAAAQGQRQAYAFLNK